ncbi:MAG: hypothetical protein WCH37_04715 [Synechococcaceae cyanobacterium ELA182]
MSAFFTTFIPNEPDADGEIGIDAELTVTNDTDQPVYQIQYKVWYSDPDGTTIWGEEAYEDVYLPPGDSRTISTYRIVNQRDLSGRLIKVRGLGCLARRDFRLLGDVSIPPAGDSTRLSAQLDLDWTSGPLTLLVSRSVPDGDGDFSLEFKILIENQSSQFLKAVILKGQLIDAEGVEIQTVETYREIPPEEAVFYSSSFSDAKLAQLERAKAIFSLKALIPVAAFEATETAELGEA